MSSEKHDMDCPIGTQRTTEHGPIGAEGPGAAAVAVLHADRATIERRLDKTIGGGVSELPLRCVWSGAESCSCNARVARHVVAGAWRRELDAGGEREARFFHFIHDGGVWMAYGLADGDVRGVYCPSHNSQRAARTRATLCRAGDVVLELPLAA
jgi:hypothetical protein